MVRFGMTAEFVGRRKPISREEREAKPFARVDGIVITCTLARDAGGRFVGHVVKGEPRKLVGHDVDEEGHINLRRMEMW